MGENIATKVKSTTELSFVFAEREKKSLYNSGVTLGMSTTPTQDQLQKLTNIINSTIFLSAFISLEFGGIFLGGGILFCLLCYVWHFILLD